MNAPERCFKTNSRLVDGAFSSGFGGGWGGVVPICSPNMASAIKGSRTRDERMEFVNPGGRRWVLDNMGAIMQHRCRIYIRPSEFTTILSRDILFLPSSTRDTHLHPLNVQQPIWYLRVVHPLQVHDSEETHNDVGIL